ncbi:KpsF/GutQ family sugar-phosphate isomerase [Vibrio owensii]|uniref:KpsF/GutQ family sugar-phosphate isomerase n=1 Tax=Vibrio owensii TaxID=696485 RepID=UPI0018F204EC|nr:KpsF/GutQ family sugar-phosphate isomerase [Vibrio owensii]
MLPEIPVTDNQSFVEEDKKVISSIRAVLQEQADALINLKKMLYAPQCAKAVRLMSQCHGHVVVTGMGKSGLIGQKISATLASTGTPSFFLHPAEAFHGDLGRITRGDVVLMISNSGETEELLKLIPSLEMFGSSVVSITNSPESTLAKNSDATLQLHMAKESCPNNLAPTTSTTLTCAIGDALAVALMTSRKFLPEDFAKFHPGGSLGRRLLTRVRDVMEEGRLPLVFEDTPMNEVMLTMTSSSVAGVAIVVDEFERLVAVITDGDIRRKLSAGLSLDTATASDLMVLSPVSIGGDAKLVTAQQLMKERKVKSLIVTDEELVVGLLDIHLI